MDMFLQVQRGGISDPRETPDSAIKTLRTCAKEWTSLGDRCNCINQRLSTRGVVRNRMTRARTSGELRGVNSGCGWQRESSLCCSPLA